MAEKKWSKDKTMKFIHLFESHEVLSNTSISEYKNKHARQIALEKICILATDKLLGQTKCR